MSSVDLKPLIGKAGVELVRVVQAIPDDALPAATPCDKFTVGGLVTHLLYWGPILELAARKLPVPTDRPAEDEHNLAVGNWRTTLTGQVQSLATAWSDPGAWAGTTSIGRADFGHLPAAFVGSLVLTEFTIHGWDLACATGAPFDCDDEVAQAAYGILAESAEHGRHTGAFGPEVAVPVEASVLHRALGVSGRDPSRPTQHRP